MRVRVVGKAGHTGGQTLTHGIVPSVLLHDISAAEAVNMVSTRPGAIE